MAQPVMYEQMVFPTRFVWAYGGKQVRLSDPFTLPVLGQTGLRPRPVGCPFRGVAAALAQR